MLSTVTVEGIKYNVLAEDGFNDCENIVKNNNAQVSTLLILRRPKGTKEFFASRDAMGVVSMC